MKPLFLFCQILIAITTLGQSTGSQLKFKGYLTPLGVANDGSLVLATEDGEVGFAGSMKGGWRRADAISSDYYTWDKKIKIPCFFNKDTGFVCGSINSKKNKYEVIYRTTDGGRKWAAVNLRQSGYVDDAVYNDKGEAWLNVAYSGIAYTKDYGLTWKRFKKPNNIKWFGKIFFNVNRQGLIGSTDNLLYYTPNNCRKWKKLPTPLDQKKYNKTNKRSSPEFNRVAIFKDHFLVVQEDLVFYSKRDSINWTWLPDYCDFYTDDINSALFFKKNKDGYVRVDDKFKPIYMFDAERARNNAKCKNGSLFILGYGNIIEWTPGNDTISTLFEKAKDYNEPEYIGSDSVGTYGYKDNKIFVQKVSEGPWDTLFTLPMLLGPWPDLDITDEGSLLYQNENDSLFYFDLTGHLQKKTSKDAMITDFLKSGIKQLVFNESSLWALQNDWAELWYTNRGNEFSDTIRTCSEENEKGMPENKDRIDAKDVADFLNQLPDLYKSTHLTSLEDIGVTENDYIQCKKDIQAFKESLSNKDDKRRVVSEAHFAFPRNNLDFDRLLDLVDTIKHMSAGKVHDLLMRLPHSHSSRIDWKSFRFVNNDNEVLYVSTTYGGRPQAYYFPWYITLNGCRVKSVDINIIRFIEKVYPAFLRGPGKRELLHELVKELY